MENQQISLTDRAAKRIVEVATKNHQAASLRVAVNGGGCSGFQYEFSISDARENDDVVIERDGATLLVDSISLVHMAGSTVDFVDDLMGQSFRIANPLAKSSCGCGTSFAL
ncbi:iron-sulfur cluster insertion protein ErpA [Aestuariivirga litoralis]|uniref:iron-sulfur cluster insertion protein ErpA n=1 Tax=Aestuariivirga litoralis TaxID=2650924 RepID=UPI0018C72643|nr:iron-sulfur cluster insertion protein ErpA [Aestuariivirga litoralis]MBG1231623.1 iron-sulfur cluster insertion protein ErpA [Aestuariivirga litoralis]